MLYPSLSPSAPCPPDAVAVKPLPMKMKIQVMHFTWTQTSCIDTEYLLMLKGNLLGDSQAMVDVSSYWTNITYFEIPLPCSTSYVATVESRNAAGTSGPSVSINRTTGKRHSHVNRDIINVLFTTENVSCGKTAIHN